MMRTLTPTPHQPIRPRNYLTPTIHSILILLFLLTFFDDVIGVGVPSISSVTPRALAPFDTTTTLTIRGSEFGQEAKELLEIRIIEIYQTRKEGEVQREYTCTSHRWINSTYVECVPPIGVLPANTHFMPRINVTHTLSYVPLLTVDASASTLILVDCYASTLCSSCWLSPPDGSSNTANDSNTKLLGLDENSLIIILAIGSTCAMILFILFLTEFVFRRTSNSMRRTPGGGKRVGQQHQSQHQHGSNRIGITTPHGLVSDDDIESEIESEVPKGVMISYSHANTPFALQLETSLIQSDFEVWIDTKITPGEDWRQNIAQAIEKSFAVVVILSTTSVQSKYCKEEIYYASQTRRAIFPIVYKDCWSQLKGGIKMLLQRIQWLNFERDTWEVCYPKLVDQLRAARIAQLATARAAAIKRRAAGGGTGGGGQSRSTDGKEHSFTYSKGMQVESFNSKHVNECGEYATPGGGGCGDVDTDDPTLDDLDDDELERMVARKLKRSSNVFQNQTAAAGTPLLKIETEMINNPNNKNNNPPHSDQPLSPTAGEPPAIEPVDVYICLDHSSRADVAVASAVRDHLRESGMVVYLSHRRTPTDHHRAGARRMRGAGGVVHDGRASPAVFDYNDTGYMSRRPSVQQEGVIFPQSRDEGGTASGVASIRALQSGSWTGRRARANDAPIGGMFAHSFAAHEDGLHSFRSMNQPHFDDTMLGGTHSRRGPHDDGLNSYHRRNRSIAVGVDDNGGGGGGEDFFESNARHMDVSSMMIFIASAVSFKSSDCADELHYAYELSLPMLQVRLDIPGLIFHEGLLHGSAGMMFQRTPYVHWNREGQTFVEMTTLYHAMKYRLQVEKARRKAEETRNKRKTLKLLGTKGNSNDLDNNPNTNTKVTNLPNPSSTPHVGTFFASQQALVVPSSSLPVDPDSTSPHPDVDLVSMVDSSQVRDETTTTRTSFITSTPFFSPMLGPNVRQDGTSPSTQQRRLRQRSESRDERQQIRSHSTSPIIESISSPDSPPQVHDRLVGASPRFGMSPPSYRHSPLRTSSSRVPSSSYDRRDPLADVPILDALTEACTIPMPVLNETTNDDTITDHTPNDTQRETHIIHAQHQPHHSPHPPQPNHRESPSTKTRTLSHAGGAPTMNHASTKSSPLRMTPHRSIATKASMVSHTHNPPNSSNDFTSVLPSTGGGGGGISHPSATGSISKKKFSIKINRPQR